MRIGMETKASRPGILPFTSERVPLHTSAAANARIAERTKQSLNAAGFDRAKIDARLKELEGEWDIERVLETHAAAAVLLGVGLGATTNRKWFLFPALVAAFLLQHATQGWCPPLPLFRRLGVRTAREIEIERTVLKARRGDLRGLERAGAENAYRALTEAKETDNESKSV
jgi:hypothetical protein